MKRLKCIIVRENGCSSEHTQGKEERLPYERAANALMNASGYVEYVAKHGYHFTQELAEMVSGDMVNADGTQHRWDCHQMLTALGNTMPQRATLGDMVYLANMAYADFYPNVLQNETRCIEYAKAVVNDMDGYDGMPFCRWTADVIGKGMSVEWNEFL